MTNYKVLFRVNGKDSDMQIQRAVQPTVDDTSVMTEVLQYVLQHMADKITGDELRVKILMIVV